MRWHHMVTVLTIVGVLVTFGRPLTLYAQQGEKYTDFRNRPYSSQDLEQALFPQEGPRIQTRGLPKSPQPLPAPAPDMRVSIALNVLFEFNSDKILPKYYDDLNKLGDVLARHTDSRFQIEGHTDSIGSERYNQLLSEKRAASVKQYLVQNFHVAPEHLRIVGFGENKPRTTNDTDEGRGVNRRVELVNLGK